MARAATSPELLLMRSDGQRSKQFLAVFQPATIYTAELNGVPGSNDEVYTIGFNNGSGTLGDVQPGMTLYVGTSAGDYDLGFCRIRKDPIAGTFYIGETSEIAWDTGGTIYLTVVDDYDLWERRMKSVSGALKADADIAYSDQHEDWEPVAVMGPDAVVWLDDGPVDVEFAEAAESWVFDSSISSYAFTSDDGAWTDEDTADAVLTISSYPTNGHINVWLTVTAANGKTHTAHRTVHCFDADHMPATAFELKNKPNASYEAGGYSFTVEMYDEASLSELRERSLVILFTKDWYDGAEDYIGPIDDRENVKFIGRVAGESIDWDADSGTVTFSVHGPQFWLARAAGYNGALTPTAAPATWGQIPQMTVDKALFVLLHWCSTATSVLDVKLTDDTRYAPEIISPAASIWEQIKEIAGRFIFAFPGCDRYGRLFVEIDPQMVPEVDRDWPTVMEIAKTDWAENIQARRAPVSEVSQINLANWQVDASGAALTNYSLAPGHVPLQHGKPEVLDGVLAADQSESNQQAGLLLGWRNRGYEFTVPFGMANFLVDLWPRQFCSIDVAAADTPRGVAYDGNLVPRTITWLDEEALTPAVVFEDETFEQESVNGDIPVGDGTYITMPHLPQLPKLPPLPPLDDFGLYGELSEEELDEGPGTLALASSNFGIMYTNSKNEDGDRQWKFMNAGLTEDQANYVKRIIRTPSGALFALIADTGTTNGADWVFYAPSLGAPWVELMDTSGLAGSSPKLVALGYNPNVSEEIAVMSGSSTDNSGEFHTGDRSGLSQLANSIDASQRLGDITYGMGKWYVTHSEKNLFSDQAFTRITAGGSVEKNAVNYTNGQDYAASLHWHKRGGGIIYEWNHDGRYLRKVEDNDGDASDTTMPSIGVVEEALPNLLAVDPTGQYLMGGHDAVIGKKSSDYGATFGNVDASLGIGYQVWENCISADAWLAATTQVVKYTPDFGDNWDDISGDLASVAPLVAIKHLLFIAW